MRKLYVILITGIVLSTSCNPLAEEKLAEPIATVFDKVLYPEDVQGLVPTGVSNKDSAQIVSQYIDQWVKRQLLVKKAEIYLTDQQKDVEKELDDYRSSLLIDRYLQQFTRQKLDTAINLDEIEKFYKEHTADFKLATNVVRALYVQLPHDAQDIKDLEELVESDAKEDLVKIEDYCYSNAIKFKTYNHDWISFAVIQMDFPIRIENPTDVLRKKKKIMHKDSISRHIIYIKEHRIEGDKTPINFVKGNIRKILLTKRKSNLIKELKNNIYTDALDHNYFEIKK